jgi:hypothetical protein
MNWRQKSARFGNRSLNTGQFLFSLSAPSFAK